MELENAPFVFVFKSNTRYEYLKPLGQGAYGYVCSAIDKYTKQKVAIKRISSLNNPIILLRTLREIQILKHFRNNKNIITIYNSIIPESFNFTEIFIVQECMEADLHYIIQKNRNLSNDHIKSLLFQLINGLRIIHEAGVIHRDLKPSNCLVNSNCVLKICDFGLARDNCYDEVEMSSYVQTRWYRSPELLLRLLKYNEKVDMWSVGCIFMEMLEKTPFLMGDNEQNQISKIITTFGAIPKELIDNIPNKNIKLKISQMVTNDKIKINEIFKGYNSDAVDLLNKLFQIEPVNRISSEEALSHNYFDSCSIDKTEVKKYISFQNDYISEDEMRSMLYEEIFDLHKSEKIEKTIHIDDDQVNF